MPQAKALMTEGNVMTAGSMEASELLTRSNAVLLLVDHQIGLYTGVRDIDVLQLKHNVVGLTQAMLAMKVPVIVTTTTEKCGDRSSPSSRKLCRASNASNARRSTPG